MEIAKEKTVDLQNIIQHFHYIILCLRNHLKLIFVKYLVNMNSGQLTEINAEPRRIFKECTTGKKLTFLQVHHHNLFFQTRIYD